MKVTIEKGEIVIRMPLNKEPKKSTSGKSMVIASTGGNQKTDVKFEGKEVVIGLNAYIKAD